MIFIRCCAKYVVWITVLSGFLVLIGGAIYLYYTASRYKSDDDAKNWVLYSSYFSFGLAGAYLLVLLCCCNKIRLGIAIMRTAADFIRDTYRVFLVPIFFFFAIAIWMAYWIVSIVFIWSVGDIKDDRKTPFASIEWSETTRYVFLYDVFGMFWVNAFLICSCQFIIAVGVCTWYFTHSADSGGSAQLCRGFTWLLRYHFGSIAFGSCVIAICEFLRFLFNYYRKYMMSRAWNNPIMKCIFYTTKYCLDCLNRVVKFITKHAFIQMALTSSNFCMSAWKAFIMILSNAGRFAVASILGAIFMFLGKVVIVTSTVILSYVIITNVSSIEKNISSPIFPLIVIGIISYLIATVFLSIFGFAMDCILQAFLVDESIAGDDSYGPHRPKTLDAFAKKKMIKSKCCCC